MSLRSLSLAVAVLLCGSGWVFGQASTLQLPNFSFSTVNTTVSVPDGGTTLLGGVSRAATGQTSRGVPIAGQLPGVGRLFGNRAIGQTRSVGQMSVTARIIDFEEEEAKLGINSSGGEGVPLVSSAARRDPVADRVNDKADFLSRNIGRREAPRQEPEAPAGPSVAEIAKRNAAAAETRQVEALDLYGKAQTAAAAGKLKVAKIYLDMSAKRATGELKDHVAAQQLVVQNALAGTTAPAQSAQP